jgi:hypothetical protein
MTGPDRTCLATWLWAATSSVTEAGEELGVAFGPGCGALLERVAADTLDELGADAEAIADRYDLQEVRPRARQAMGDDGAAGAIRCVLVLLADVLDAYAELGGTLTSAGELRRAVTDQLDAMTAAPSADVLAHAAADAWRRGVTA